MISKLISKLLDFIESIILRTRTKFFLNRTLKSVPPKNKTRMRDNFLFKYAKNVSENMIRNNINIDDYVKTLDLDLKSKQTIKMFIERVKYIYTHDLLDVDKLFSNNEKIKREKIRKFLTAQKKKIYLPIDIYETSAFCYKVGLKYLPQEVINNLEYKDFIDGGAWIGDTALIFEKYYCPKKIYSFEPDEKNYQYMKETIENNNLKKVVPLKIRLGERDGILKLKSYSSASYISEKGDSEIDTTTIDNFFFKIIYQLV